MHILFLTDNFPPEVNAPASRTYEHAREWVRLGHQVTIVTCAPNFPNGKLFEGYKNRLIQSEMVDGIKVLRAWSYITANEGFYKRSLDYASFAISALIATLFVKRVDVIIGTSPQFFTVCSAFMVSLIKRRPWVFELRDIWPESIKVVGALKDGRILRLLEKIELFLYRRSTLIISVTHEFKEALVRRGIAHEKIHVVTNGADLSRFQPRPKPAHLVSQYNLDNMFVAGYIGTHGMAHGLETILDAAKLLMADPKGKFLRIFFIGNGARKYVLMKRAEELRLDNVVFIDSVPKNEVADYWALLDLSIIHLKKDPLFEKVIPSKLFEAMAMGIPVVIGVKGEAAELVLRECVGETFEPENADELAAIIMRLSEQSDRINLFCKNALTATPKYDRKVKAEQMLELLKSI